MKEQNYITDSKGRLVPREMVKTQELLEDELVKSLYPRARELAAAMEAFRAEAFDEVDAFLDLLVAEYGERPRGGRKGNTFLRTYDGQIRVQVAVNESVEFGPELVAAREMIDTCIEEWTNGANPHLVTLVHDAFTADSNGRLSTARVLGLRRMNIADARWHAAMQALSDAVRVTDSKRYIRFQRRNKHGKYEMEA